jgi:alpha-galactosidase
MIKITFLGAGSTVFSKNVLGDCLLTDSLKNIDIALYDIDPDRLEESYTAISTINKTYGKGAKIKKYLGVEQRREALRDADFVINAVQIGGYDPCTITDFEIPKKYGLRQTIGDTIGIGGIFRGLRTIPVMLDFVHDMEEVCPDAWFLNYTNPMAILTGAVLLESSIKTVGLCHSVQVCAKSLLDSVGMKDVYDDTVEWTIAGINHQAWLLSITKNGEDLYPEIKRRVSDGIITDKYNLVRLEIMKVFGYYVTESSEHLSEYLPYFIKNRNPELIDRFNIPLDEYPRRCVEHIKDWARLKKELVDNPNLTHTRSNEYASYIIEAMVTNKPIKIGANVLNTGLITNLPSKACVEVPCVVDASGIVPTYVGDLPEQLAAINRTNINPQLLTIEAALTRKKEKIYQAALLDPHTSAELTIDEIIKLCDDLIEAHGDWLPKYY